MVRFGSLDFNGESFEQRLARMPELLSRKHLISLRLFESVESINFAVKRGHLPAIVKGRDMHFVKKEIKKWLMNRD